VSTLARCLALFLALTSYPAMLRAAVIVSTSLSLTSFQILPSTGSVQFIHPTTASAFAQVFDTLGGSDQQFNTIDDGSTSAVAATALAHAMAAASAPALTASAVSGVNIPELTAGAGTVPGSTFGSLQGFFQIVGATSPVSVQLKALLAANQSLATTSSGQSADSEVTFSLLLPDISDTPVLFMDNLLHIGPSNSRSASSSPTLTNLVTLMPNTQYLWIAQTDSESSGTNTVPEPQSLLLGSSGLVLFALWVARLAHLRHRA